jgi:phosphatidate cytidylyltransferase
LPPLIAIIIALLFREVFSALFFVFNIFTLIEYFKLLNSKPENDGQRLIGVTGGSVLYVLVSLVSLGLVDKKWLILILLIPVFIIIIRLYINKPNPVDGISKTIFGIVYISVPFSILNFFYNPAFISGDVHPNVLLGFFLILWTADSFAYLTGVTIGKHKLFKRISPQKTWEGTIGGFVFGMAVSWILSLYFLEYNLMNWLAIGFLTVLFGTFGDLAESMLKRSMNVKDSGKMLPGHGGFLDRFDAALLAAPVVFIYLLFAA